jgi:fatty-acyl-CoA synthase
VAAGRFPEPGPHCRIELTPLSFLRRAAEDLADRLAVVDGAERRTYGEFGERAGRLASSLIAGGIEPGDRIAVLAPNRAAMLEAHFAVPAAGAVLVPLNTRLSAAELEVILADAAPRIVLADTDLAGSLPRHPDTVLIGDGGPRDPYERLLAAGRSVPLDDTVPTEDGPLTLTYTSGTTGRPKGVIQSHRATYLTALGMALEAGLSQEAVVLWTLPMFHGAGWAFVWAVTAVAGRHVCLREFDPARAWQLIADEEVTHYNAAPTVHLALLHHPAARRPARTVTAGVAGAPPTASLLARMERFGLRPLHVYGLTETLPHTVNHDPHHPARQGTRAVHTGPVRVVADDGHDVPTDGSTLGEVLLRGNNITPGYYGRPEETAEAMAGGWFHTGDLAVHHPDGSIELRDRRKDIIISGGENISGAEVEDVLCGHPAVLECAVVGIPDEKWGERPRAYVTLVTDHPATVTAAELIAFCRERLAHYKCPDSVVFTELPKTATGKIQKAVLRARARSGRWDASLALGPDRSSDWGVDRPPTAGGTNDG